MKVTRAQIYLTEIDRRFPIVLRLWSDEGVFGLGEAAVAYGRGSGAAAALVQDLVGHFVIGCDPFRIERIWTDMYDHSFWAKGGGPIIYAGISAIEMALVDLKARALGIPAYDLLGGKVHDEIRVYANGWSFQADTPDDHARAVEKVLRDGYDAVKFYPTQTPLRGDPSGRFAHVSRREIDRAFADLAVARVKAVRDAAGRDVDLMVDLSAELTTDAVIALGRRMQDYDLMFLEEPVEPANHEALKRVADRLEVPIAVGERLYTRYGFRRVLELQAAAILQPDPGNTGGIGEARKIAAMAEAYNMRMAPHLCAGPVATAATMQLDAALPNLLIQELYPYRKPEHFALVDRPLETEVRNGRMIISDLPGYGVALQEERIAPFLFAEVVG
jgi:galactonate dehydratase